VALTEAEISKLITTAKLKKFAQDIKASIAAALVRDCPKTFAENGLNTPVHIAHFFAQVGKETGGLRRLDENMNYTTLKALRAPFRKFREMSDAKASTFLRNPKKLGNFIYANKNGNRNEASGDGFNFRGSGLIQLTGRGNFKKAAKEIEDEVDFDIVKDPELARSEGACVRIAVAFWTTREINKVAGTDSQAAVDKVTAKVNPGEPAKGKQDRRDLFKKARTIFK
jgi:predicted chitinase